jgi:hypothetical protein
MVQAVPATTQIHLIRDTGLDQELDLQQGGTFSAENVESGFDHAGKQSIEQDDVISRSIHTSDTDTSGGDLILPNATARVSTYLTFDSSGDLTVTNSLVTGTATISNYGATIIDDADASAAQTTLGFAAFIKTLFSLTTAAQVLTTLGVSTFIQTLLNDTTATMARATLEIIDSPVIVCYEGSVVCYEEETVTYL